MKNKYYIPKRLIKGSEAVPQMCSVKKVFLEILQNSKKKTCARVPFLIDKVAGLRALAQVFSCEFCKISKNTFSHRTALEAASEGFRVRSPERRNEIKSV